MVSRFEKLVAQAASATSVYMERYGAAWEVGDSDDPKKRPSCALSHFTTIPLSCRKIHFHHAAPVAPPQSPLDWNGNVRVTRSKDENPKDYACAELVMARANMLWIQEPGKRRMWRQFLSYPLSLLPNSHGRSDDTRPSKWRNVHCVSEFGSELCTCNGGRGWERDS